MLKYQKKGLCKALSIILAVAMLLTTSIGITHAYALEGEQPKVIDVQGELPLGESEGAEPDEVLDDSKLPEKLALPTNASLLREGSALPEFAEGYPRLGEVQADGSKKVQVLVKGVLPEDATEMGLGYVLLADGDSVPTAEQIKSAGGKIPGVTVITWAQHGLGDSEQPITLTGAQDDTDYEFYAVCWNDDLFSEVKHLAVKTPAGSGEPGSPTLAPPTGLQWDTEGGVKAKWDAVANATSYAVTLYKKGHSFMLGEYTVSTGTEVSFQSNITGYTGNYYFTVQAKAEGYISSVKPASPIYSYIAPLYGNVTIDNMSPKIGDTLTGSLINGNNTGTLHYVWKAGGSYVGANAVSYTVTEADLGKAITLEITSDVETGTRTSNATAEVSAATKILDVSKPEELEAALGSVSDGGTIALRNSIDYDKGIIINAKSFCLDLGSYTLDVVNSTGIGIDIKNATLTVLGGGKLNATGTKGVQAQNSKISVYSATGTAGAGVEAFCGIDKSCEVTVTTLAQGTIAGAYAMNDNCKITATSAKATGSTGKAVYAEVGGTVEISGNVDAPNGYGVYCVNSSATIGGYVTSKNTAVFLYEKGSIVINGNVNADNGSGTAVEIDGNGIPSNGTVTIGGTVSSLDAFYVRFVNGFRTKNEGVPDGAYLKYTDSVDGEKAGIIRVKRVNPICTIGAQEFTSLSDAIAAASNEETTTITLLQSITHNGPVVINGKSITFALGGFDLTIDTSAISNSIGLHVKGDGKVNCTGSGKFNVVGSNDGVRASGGSELHISGNVTARQYAVTAGSAPGIGTPKITVDGDITVTGQEVNAWSEVEAVSVGGYATVTIGGNVTANRTDERQLVTAVYSNASTIVVGKNVITQGSGVNAQNGGKVTIGGALHYNPTGSGDQAYIKVGYPVVAKTADDFEPTSIKPEYKEYKNGDNVVWVKEAPAVCTIGAQKFTSLDAAVASVPAGGTATITLLQKITHTKHIRVEKKTINLDLMDYDLLLDTSTDGSYSPALMVIDGGKVNLIGSGTGKFNIKSYMTAISAIGINSKATVHNVVAGDSNGVRMVGSGDYLDSNSTVTVLGSITVGNGNGVSVNAKDGKVVVGGNIVAGRVGVDIASNPGTQVTVNGDIIVDGDSSIAGVWAYGSTTVAVTGNVTVRGTNCVGVHASGSTIKVDGNVVSSGKGAHSDTNGKVEITGSLTAGTPFITVGTTDMTTDQGTEIGGGSLLYTDGTNTVQIGSAGVSVPTYTITVQNDGHGAGGASLSSAEAGTEIILTVTPSSGYVFKEWQIISGGVTITGNKFTMPANNVTVKAIFEKTSVQTYTVTVNGSHASTSGAGSYTKDANVNIYAGNRSNYTFTGWTSSDVTITGTGSKNASFVMPGKAVTVTANWSYNGSGGGGSDSSCDSGSTTTITTPEKKPDQPILAVIAITVTAGENGTASAAIPDKVITDAIAKAQSSAKAQGKTAFSMELNVAMPRGATSLTVVLTQSSLQSLVNAGITSLEINGSPVTVSFDKESLAEIRKQSSGDVAITIKLERNLSVAAKKLIGSRPVYDITVSYVKNGKSLVISAFNGGIATISIPYKPGKNEATGYLYGVYVDAKGNAARIEGSAYDANARAILISTGRLSVYGIGYTAPSAKFTDIGAHWSKEAIDYVVGRGLLSGISETTFAPNTAMTRGMLVTALGRLEGVDTKLYTTNSFIDVKTDSTFRPYIEWAYKKGVVQGIGNQQFAPNRAITREEIAVIFANYAKATSYKLPVTREASTYEDASSIGSVYKTAVTAMQQAGIMIGGTNNKFNPKVSATRAEVSSMLHRYIKLTIDPDTAQGWSNNDAGQWFYYKDGKVFTGTQTIDDVKYFFNTDGTLKTGWVKDGGNWRFYSGNRALVGWWDIGSGDEKKSYYFDAHANMTSSKWLEVDGEWYYFNIDGSLARSTTVDGYKVDENGIRKTE